MNQLPIKNNNDSEPEREQRMNQSIENESPYFFLNSLPSLCMPHPVILQRKD
jgi:hypothetical protein